MLDITERPKKVSFPCLRLEQPIGEFFIGTMEYSLLTQIADFDVRRVIQDERDVERYLGIQRPLNPARVRDLEIYVNTFDATFPTSIIVAVDERCVSFDPTNNTMILSNYIDDNENRILFRHIARVLDGQHRIAGLYKYAGGKPFDLSVTIFTGIDIADQAQIFATVNLEQTKVNKSLAYDLYSLARTRSPQKTCHNIAVALDQSTDGPLCGRIKRLGIATPGRFSETITQATFVESLMRFISDNPVVDRDTLLRDRQIRKENADTLKKLPFRNMFIDERDIEIARILENYFSAIRSRWPEAWNSFGLGAVLNKTNGFRALMRLLRPAYLYISKPGEVPLEEQFLKLFRRSTLSDQHFDTIHFPPGTSGESELYKKLLADLDLL